MDQTEALDARTYLDKHGDAGVMALVSILNRRKRGPRCTAGYFKQFAYGYRRPSPELAEHLVDASRIVAARKGHQDVLDFMSLLKARQIHAAKARK
jgi:hypothetical protein